MTDLSQPDWRDVNAQTHKDTRKGCKCCDGECHHDDCCGKIEENCRTNCKFHTSTEDWETELQFNILEDYLFEAAMAGADDDALHKDNMRGHFKKLKDFIRSLLRAKQEERAKVFDEAFEDGVMDERARIVRLVEGMKCNECQCLNKLHCEMNRCTVCRLVCKDARTVNDTLTDLISKIKM